MTTCVLIDAYRLKRGLRLLLRDGMMDVGMAHAVCAKGILVPEPGDQYNIEKEIRESTTKPDFRADTFMQAVDWILERLDKRD